MRVIFFGSPSFAIPSFRKLREEGHEIIAVFTQPDKPAGRGLRPQSPPIKIEAERAGVPVHQPEKIDTEEVKEKIFDLAPEAIVVAAYGKILPKWLVEHPPRGSINVHASLLPKYRGAAPINWAIINGETCTGITIMRMDEGMDTGDIVLQRSASIGPEETAGELEQRLAELGAELLAEALRLIEKSEAEFRKQDHAQATYAPRLKPENGRIDWAKSARDLHNLIRGLNPSPGAFAFLRGKRVALWRSRPLEDAPSPGPRAGEIIRAGSDGILVACGQDTLLNLLELQMEGRRRLPAGDFVNGLRLRKGERFD